MAIHDLVGEVQMYNSKDIHTVSSDTFYKNTIDVVEKLIISCTKTINDIQRKNDDK